MCRPFSRRNFCKEILYPPGARVVCSQVALTPWAIPPPLPQGKGRVPLHLPCGVTPGGSLTRSLTAVKYSQ